jgi:hypothetical protein
VLVDVEHAGLDVVALLELLAGVADALAPGEVADVHEAVDALLDADEDAEVGDVPDLALDDRADGVLLLDEVPGVLSSCFMPRLMRLFSMSMPRTLASTMSPMLTSLEGCLMRLFQVISEMWTRPSMPSSSSTNAP